MCADDPNTHHSLSPCWQVAWTRLSDAGANNSKRNETERFLEVREFRCKKVERVNPKERGSAVYPRKTSKHYL